MITTGFQLAVPYGVHVENCVVEITDQQAFVITLNEAKSSLGKRVSRWPELASAPLGNQTRKFGDQGRLTQTACGTAADLCKPNARQAAAGNSHFA